jgi:predicted HTH domain antitoxin
MSKVSVEIELPDVIRGTPLEERLRSVIARQNLERAVVELYKKHEISTGTGAKMLDMPLHDFIQFLGEHKVSIFDFTDETWQAELESVGLLNKL